MSNNHNAAVEYVCLVNRWLKLDMMKNERPITFVGTQDRGVRIPHILCTWTLHKVLNQQRKYFSSSN